MFEDHPEFHRSLYGEHFISASSLHGQMAWRKAHLDADEAQRERQAALFEAHLDALCVGEERALTVASDSVDPRRRGDVYVLVALLCRRGLWDELPLFAAKVDSTRPAMIEAIVDALRRDPEQRPRVLEVASVSLREEVESKLDS
ncbi:MAG: hypothetical protein AAGA56_19515 [Myxococcota bacterium]